MAGPAELGDHVGHGVGLAGARHPQQGLEHQPIVDALGQLADRLRLIPAGRERAGADGRDYPRKPLHARRAIGLIGHDKMFVSSQSAAPARFRTTPYYRPAEHPSAPLLFAVHLETP